MNAWRKKQGGHDSDEHMGAVEGERPGDPQPGNANADALDEHGMPGEPNPLAISEDVIGANEDGTEG